MIPLTCVWEIFKFQKLLYSSPIRRSLILASTHVVRVSLTCEVILVVHNWVLPPSWTIFLRIVSLISAIGMNLLTRFRKGLTHVRSLLVSVWRLTHLLFLKLDVDLRFSLLAAFAPLRSNLFSFLISFAWEKHASHRFNSVSCMIFLNTI